MPQPSQHGGYKICLAMRGLLEQHKQHANGIFQGHYNNTLVNRQKAISVYVKQ